MGRRHKLRVHSDDSSTYVEESFEVMFVESMGGDFFLRGGVSLNIIIMRGGVEINSCLMRGGYDLVLGHISPISQPPLR